MPGASIITQTTDVFQSGREAEERRCDYVCALVLVDTTAPRDLVLPVRDALDPRLPTSEVRVVGANSYRDLLAPTLPDVCVAIMGRDTSPVVSGVCELAAAGVPVAIVAESALDVPPLPLGETAASRVSILAATSSEVLLDRLAEWLVDATDKGIAFAANFPFCRKAKVRELVNEHAMEMAMTTAKMGPGAELPSMTLSQARLALAIAAVNGQPLALGRIPEVLSAIGAGFGSRMFANKTLGKIPAVGWIFQAGFGYLGTQATGRSLQHRFDKKEQKASGLVQKTPSTGERVASGVSSARRLAREVRERMPRSSGDVVKHGPSGEVRLLADPQDGEYLIYDEGAAQ